MNLNIMSRALVWTVHSYFDYSGDIKLISLNFFQDWNVGKSQSSFMDLELVLTT